MAERRYRTGWVAESPEFWFSQLLDSSGRLVEDGRFVHGVAANRAAVDTFLRYHYEQGLSNRQLRCEDIFPTELLDT